MSGPSDIAAVYDAFCCLEDRYGLLDYRIDGVKFWQADRTGIYYELLQRLRLWRCPHPSAPVPALDKIRNYWRSLFLFNPFFSGSTEVVIVDHERKVQSGGEYADIYTAPLIADFLAQGTSFEVYEFPWHGRHWTASCRQRKHLEIIFFGYCGYKYAIPVRISSRHRKFLADVQQDMQERFGTAVAIAAAAVRIVRLFKAGYWWYRRLLERKRPRQVYVVTGYARAPLIAAAKDLRISVRELQHGLLSRYHPGYGPRSGGRDYLPDQLWVWDAYWKQHCPLPLPAEDVVVYPSRRLEQAKQRYRAVAKKERQVVVISQGAVGPEIAEYLLRHSRALRHCSLVYKLHPSEGAIWHTYPALVELSRCSAVTILADERRPLYELLAESSFVIGVFSTALYEALAFQCRVYIMDLPGAEYMRDFLESGRMSLFDSGTVFGPG